MFSFRATSDPTNICSTSQQEKVDKVENEAVKFTGVYILL